MKYLGPDKLYMLYLWKKKKMEVNAFALLQMLFKRARGVWHRIHEPYLLGLLCDYLCDTSIHRDLNDKAR